ncbi:MAG: endonuclease III [Bacteroidetes bacterium]|nr:MAG: endonuclease III [Bacteroidota bacterium]
MLLAERYQAVIDYFLEANPNPESELNFSNAYELLVAVILSAQCTDVRVNLLTPALFEAYPTAGHLAQASVEDILSYVRSCSYPNSKAKHLKGMAEQLVANFGGEVPQDHKSLTSLPGVGRKTANVVLSVMFDEPALAVDTHVFRVARRIGLTRGAKTPDETERQLTRHIPREYWSKAHHWLILHGRYICLARSPKCGECGLEAFCAKRGVE